MKQPEKVIRAAFFELESGRQPVREWLKDELTDEQRYEIGSDIRIVELRWPVGMPKVRKIEADLWEVRTGFHDGIARVFFTVQSDWMILLHGFIKKSQATAQRELDIARKRLSVVQRG